MPDWFWSELPFAVILLGITCLFFWLASRQQSRGKWLGRPQKATISWLGSYSQAFQRALDLLPPIHARLIDADPNRGYILAATGASLRTFGTTIKVSFLTQEGVTFVQVEAGPSASLFDWGESRGIVNRFLKLWDQLPPPIDSYV